MCGIAGVYFHNPKELPIGSKDISTLVDTLLHKIENRGKDATGVAAISPTGDLHIEKADLEAETFTKWRRDLPVNLQTILLHTRYATKGTTMNLDNNHPIVYENVIVTHNGHISNDDKLFADQKIDRKAQVDSEIIAALFNKHGIEKANLALQQLDGNMAVAVSDLRKPNVLVLAKGRQSPLEYYLDDSGVIWASTKLAIEDALKAINVKIKWNEIKSLSQGELLLIENGRVEEFKFSVYNKPITTVSQPARSQQQHSRAKTGENGGYDWQDNYYSGKSGAKASQIPEDDHPVAFTIFVAGEKLVYKKCDGCEDCFRIVDLSKYGFLLLCEDCLGEKPGEEEDTIIVVGKDGESTTYSASEAHEVVCELLAESHKTTPYFVNWLLFEAEDDDYDSADPGLVNLYSIFSDDYDKIYKELTGTDNICTLPSLERAEKLREEERDMQETIESLSQLEPTK